ncbi:hypothetical protein ACFQY9_06775 [Microvirga aerilata]|uniref:hypothetical protein n=1 Tax=Microvirga aerilata TaxID=670292 RepID=UPI0036321B70
MAGGALSWNPWPWTDHDEKIRAFSLFYDRVTRTRIEGRRYEYPLYVREHAISRFLERSDRDYASVTRSLWPSLLLVELIERSPEPFVARPFLLPCPGGAFLGLAVTERLPSSLRGAQTSIITKTGAQEYDCAATVPVKGRLFFVNTYVHDDELRQDQRLLCTAVSALIERHRPALIGSLLSRVMIVYGEPDDLGLDIRFPRSGLNEALSDFTQLLASHLWRDTMRMPTDGVFRDYVTLQIEQQDKVRTQ